MGWHAQTECKDLDGNVVEVDEGIVNLVAQLWQMGIRTRWSCQGDESRTAYVTVIGKESFSRVLGILLSSGSPFRDEVMGSRIRACPEVKKGVFNSKSPLGGSKESKWELGVHASLGSIEEMRDKTYDGYFIGFPAKALAGIEDLVSIGKTLLDEEASLYMRRIEGLLDEEVERYRIECLLAVDEGYWSEFEDLVSRYPGEGSSPDRDL